MFHGDCTVRVQQGSVEVFGAVLTPQSPPLHLSAPRLGPSIVLRALAPAASATGTTATVAVESKPKKSKASVAPADAVLVIETQPGFEVVREGCVLGESTVQGLNRWWRLPVIHR